MDYLIQKNIGDAHYTIDATDNRCVYIYVKGAVTHELLASYTRDLIALMERIVGPEAPFLPVVADVQQAEPGILRDLGKDETVSLFARRTEKVFAIVDPQSAQLQGTVQLVTLLTGAEKGVTIVQSFDDVQDVLA